MRTKLSVFCGGLIEAGGLAAVILLPAYMSIYSARIFEMSKSALLRSIALVMLLAWLVGAVERWQSTRSKQEDRGMLQQALGALRRPMILPILLVVLTYFIATATSVWPRASIRGSYRRNQGTYTFLSYVVIFLTLWHTVRRRQQVERLVLFGVLTSVPLAWYAVMQHFGVDAIVWGQDVSTRVTATLGNPIFVGAYLIMVVPLTVKQILDTVLALKSRSDAGPVHVAALVVFSVILLLQMTALVFTQSRGPFIGFIAGGFFFLLLAVASRRRRDLGIAVLSFALLIGLFLGILNLPNTPLAGVKQLPYVGRLADIVGSRGLESRFFIWDGAADMLSSTPLRTAVGHGPEVMMEAYQPYMVEESLNRGALSHDRTHNALWQALIDRGILGAMTDYVFFGALFYCGLRWLGLIAQRRDQILLLVLVLAGVLVGLIAPWALLGRVALIGLGVPAGLLLGLASYLVIHLFTTTRQPEQDWRTSLLIIALLSGVIAHFVEIHTGIGVTVTNAHLWTYAALIVVLGLDLRGERDLTSAADTLHAPPPRSRGRRRTRNDAPSRAPVSRSLLIGSMAAGLLVVGLIFSLITHRFQFPADSPIVAFLLAIWLFSGLVIVLREARQAGVEQAVNWSHQVVVYAGVSLGVISLPLALHIASLPPSPNPGYLVLAHFASFGTILLVIAAATLRGPSLPQQFWRGKRAWIYLPMAAATVVAILLTNANVVRANIYYDAAMAEVQRGSLDSAIILYKRARGLDPGESRYALFLGRAYLRKATAGADHPEIFLREAEEAMLEARALSPVDPEVDTNLGQVYWFQANLVADTPQRKIEALETAVAYYSEAVKQSPIVQADLLNQARWTAWLELARTYAEVGVPEEALEAAQHARELAPKKQYEAIDQFIENVTAQAN